MSNYPLAPDVRKGFGWTVGFLNSNASVQELRMLFKRDVPILLIVDYAENQREKLTAIVEELLRLRSTSRRCPTRVAALARDTGGWFDGLLRDTANARTVVEAKPTKVLPVPNRDQNRNKIWKIAYSKFAHFFQQSNQGLDAPDLSNPAYNRVLMILIDAMNTVLRATPTISVGEKSKFIAMLDELLEHETRYWQPILNSLRQPIRPLRARFQRLMALVTLMGGTKEQAELIQLMELPNFLDNLTGDQRLDVAEQLKTLYPSSISYLFGLEPDLLGERLVQNELLRSHGNILIEHVFGDLNNQDILVTSQMRHGLTVFSRMLQWDSKVNAQLVQQVVLPRGALLALEAYRLLPRESLELQELNIELIQKLMTAFPNEFEFTAWLENDLGILLRLRGEFFKAVSALTEAVAKFEILAHQNPDQYQLPFLRAVDNLSVAASKLENGLQIAYSHSRTVVAKCFRQYHKNQAIFKPYLREFLLNFSNRLMEMERFQHVLKLQPQIDLLFSPIDELHPIEVKNYAIFQIINANAERGLGDFSQAKAYLETAINLLHPIALKFPDFFLDNLAEARINLSEVMIESKNFDQAIEPAKLATECYQQLFTSNRLVGVRLGRALNVLGIGFIGLESYKEGFDQARELQKAASKLVEIQAFYEALLVLTACVRLRGDLDICGYQESWSEPILDLEALSDIFIEFGHKPNASKSLRLTVQMIELQSKADPNQAEYSEILTRLQAKQVSMQ